MSGYTLADPRPIAESAPYTYFLPNDAQIAAVGVGDHVKLVFDYDGPVEDFDAERMWVTVSAVTGSTLTGTLANHPGEPNAPVKYGDVVTFDRALLIDIDWADPERAPSRTPRRGYWDRCLVDHCVLTGEPVDYLYREEPDMTQEGDRYPDSGWRIRASAAAIEANENGPEYIALGKVLNQDDSWLPLIDAPVGSAFRRGEDGGYYAAD
ncbi:immunity protein Imm33 domain-containing protein [Sphingomonas sp. Y38-1Y]|uniref:immunity protein Imm33 domain-containing protein n=1 Tax=Sphingomonas sp. Y38-1Y TaxID=3078265 RepID=UPI0028EF346B|nr:DUF2185 domain-containing protein [Sphingomonas sp. Y38-1Y]